MTEYIDILVKRASDLQERKYERRREQEAILERYKPLKKLFWDLFWELKGIYFKKSEDSWIKTKVFRINAEFFGLNTDDEDDEEYDDNDVGNSISWKIELKDVTKEHVVQAIKVINDHFDEYRQKNKIKRTMQKVDVDELLDKYEKTQKVKQNFIKICKEIQGKIRKINNVMDDRWFSDCEFLVFEKDKKKVRFIVKCETCSFEVYEHDKDVFKDYLKTNLFDIPLFSLEEIEEKVLKHIENEIEKKEKEENKKR